MSQWTTRKRYGPLLRSAGRTSPAAEHHHGNTIRKKGEDGNETREQGRHHLRSRSYAAALSVLVVAEWLYLDWASRAPQPLPNNFVHAEWITLHDNSNFRGFVDFLRTELDRVGPAHADLCRDFFSRAVALELSFFEAAYTTGSPEPLGTAQAE